MGMVTGVTKFVFSIMELASGVYVVPDMNNGVPDSGSGNRGC